ncbi:MAG: helix-turn-helix transcriptional regulator [Clostridiales bacterium]|nr:helix-turn-helix transcriptional regulator [Clostridiales bacterium]
MLKSRLKVLLAERDMSQVELSNKISVRQPTISAIANNKAKHIPMDVACKLCKEFDCQLSDIWTYIPDNE